MDWRALRDTLDRPTFVARVPHPFLLVLAAELEDPAELKTSLLTAMELPTSPISEDSPGATLAVTKSGANPYEDRVIVGRARNCDIVLRDPSVSKFHAELRLTAAGIYEVTDRSSRNGTHLNGQTLIGGYAAPIASGDRIRFGAVPTVFLDAGALYDVTG
jgi:hypothetical protein